MIVVAASMEMNPLILELENIIDIGMELGAYAVAKELRARAASILHGAVKNHGGKWTGNLALDSTTVKRAMTGLKNYARYDMVIDTRRAPYAYWVELGRYAPASVLPYANSDKRDYSKSDFKGYAYLQKSIRYVVGKDATRLVTEAIILALSNPASYVNMGEVLEV